MAPNSIAPPTAASHGQFVTVKSITHRIWNSSQLTPISRPRCFSMSFVATGPRYTSNPRANRKVTTPPITAKSDHRFAGICFDVSALPSTDVPRCEQAWTGMVASVDCDNTVPRTTYADDQSISVPTPPHCYYPPSGCSKGSVPRAKAGWARTNVCVSPIGLR